MKKKNEIRIKVSLKKIFIVVIIFFTLLIVVEYFEPKLYYDLKNKLSYKLDIKSSIHWYNRGLARREQIILVLLSDGINYIGNGAYAYFDILTGKFAKTFRHFSQLIWTYYDLGIIGLGLFFYYVKSLNGLFKSRRTNYNICLTFALVVYSFFTITTFDFSFMLTYFIYKRKNED
jgi:hypothetical protein